jgi:hypothetical protein
LAENLTASEVVKADVCTHTLLDDFALHAAGGSTEKPDPLKLLEVVSMFKGARFKILLQVSANKFRFKGHANYAIFEAGR